MLDTVQNPSRGPVLGDGLAVADLVDMERREVSARVFSDKDLYEFELEHIWAKTWILMGHESEIPNRGDFVSRRLGDDPVILVRGKDGQIECLLNVCPHRGAAVCRAEAGNTPAFRCIYHGWIFNLDGTIRGVPYREHIYVDPVDEAGMNLHKARVEQFCGLVFVTWNENAPSLEEHLGDFAFYLRLMFDRTEKGLEVLGPPQRFVVDANWKTAAEQFAGDAGHANQLHRSLALANGANVNDPAQWQLYAPKVSTPEGNNTICFDIRGFYEMIAPGQQLTAAEKLTMLPPPGVPRELVGEVLAKLTPEEMQFLADTPPSNGGMFPHIGLWSMSSMLPDGTPDSFLSFRTYSPVGVDKFEFTMWVMVARGASEEFRNRLRYTTSWSQGATGFVEQDDGEIWPGQTASARGFMGRKVPLKYWAIAGNNPPEAWPGKGNVHTGFAKDDTQWQWWVRYFELMTGE